MREKADVIVVGAGSSGLMATIQAAEQGVRVILIEKNPQAGRKLLLTGGGRCNVTNRTTKERLIEYIPGNGKFLYSALSQFDPEDIVAFFENAGVALKEEDHGRMFPTTDRSKTILDTLLATIKDLDVDILYQSPVSNIILNPERTNIKGVQLENGDIIEGKTLILATGGRAYPATGATGDAYGWVEQLGHTVSELYATEAPLLSSDSFITSKELKGTPLRDVEVTVWDGAIGGQAIVHHRMDMIFTHFGYSGPAILRCSGHVNLYLRETKDSVCHLSIDLIPDLSIEQLEGYAQTHRDQQLITILKRWMPEKMAHTLTKQIQLPADKRYKQLDSDEPKRLWQAVKYFPMSAYGSQPIEKGFVTGGGVCTDEVNPSTMESRIIDGLYFCGELLDINGYTGGYNITAAFVTGTVAGRQAAWASMAQ